MATRLTQSLRRGIAALAAAAMLAAQPASAQSILRDAETEALLADMSTGIVKAAGLDPRNVQVVVINDPSINAFVAGGQIVYIHSGLIEAASNANEVQGVIAHEVGHIADGHVLSGEAAMKPAMGMTILSMVLGLAAMAAGSGDAGAGIMAMGQQAAMGKYLAFSRTQESTATGLRSTDEVVSTVERLSRPEVVDTVDVVVTGSRVIVASECTVLVPLLVFVVPPARVSFMSSSPVSVDVTSAVTSELTGLPP